jgi:hypothetical protein
MTDDAQPADDANPADAASLGDAHGEWYYCFKHKKVERRDDCQQRDRMGPYPTQEAAEHWQDRVAQRNETWEKDDEDDE